MIIDTADYPFEYDLVYLRIRTFVYIYVKWLVSGPSLPTNS